MTVPKRVQFPEEAVASIHVYEGMDDNTVSSMFYTVNDYNRFRVERAQEEIEREKAALRMSMIDTIKIRRPCSRRDSLTMGRKSARHDSHSKGMALAA